MISSTLYSSPNDKRDAVSLTIQRATSDDTYIDWTNGGENRRFRSLLQVYISSSNLPNTNRTRVLFGSSSIRTEPNKDINVRNPAEHEPNKGIVRFCSMWRRTRTNRTGPRKCSVLFVCSVSHLCPGVNNNIRRQQ